MVECLVSDAPARLLEADLHDVVPHAPARGNIEHIGAENASIPDGTLEIVVAGKGYLLHKRRFIFISTAHSRTVDAIAETETNCHLCQLATELLNHSHTSDGRELVNVLDYRDIPMLH